MAEKMNQQEINKTLNDMIEEYYVKMSHEDKERVIKLYITQLILSTINKEKELMEKESKK
jgi:hypothetical protein